MKYIPAINSNCKSDLKDWALHYCLQNKNKNKKKKKKGMKKSLINVAGA
jgi:hypothetical protein